MVAINFSPQFAGPVERREKRQTIRRKARIRPGQRAQLYTGQRTKACRKLAEDDPVCVEVLPVRITRGTLEVDGACLMSDTAAAFARADGFKDFNAMADWFAEKYGGPVFEGYVIKWDWPAKLSNSDTRGSDND